MSTFAVSANVRNPPENRSRLSVRSFSREGPVVAQPARSGYGGFAPDSGHSLATVGKHFAGAVRGVATAVPLRVRTVQNPVGAQVLRVAEHARLLGHCRARAHPRYVNEALPR
jgi:hypothetical protein